jgi:hypothetical protein
MSTTKKWIFSFVTLEKSLKEFVSYEQANGVDFLLRQIRHLNSLSITLANKLKKKIVTVLVIGALGCIIPSNYKFHNENSSSRTNFELQANIFFCI